MSLLFRRLLLGITIHDGGTTTMTELTTILIEKVTGMVIENHEVRVATTIVTKPINKAQDLIGIANVATTRSLA